MTNNVIFVLVRRFGSSRVRLRVCVSLLLILVFPLSVFSEERRKGGSDSPLEANIIDIYAGNPIIDLGEQEGVQRGDEFELLEEHEEEHKPAVEKNELASEEHEPADSDGGETEREGEKALVVVKRVDERNSETSVRYGLEHLEEGRKLREIERLGIESGLFFRYTHFGWETETESLYSAGTRVVFTRPFYALRPFVELSFPFGDTTSIFGEGFPSLISLGGELNWVFGRMKVSPAIGVGLAFILSDTEEEMKLQIPNYGGTMRVSFSYLLFRDIQLYFETGAETWIRLGEPIDSFGPFAAFGISLKM